MPIERAMVSIDSLVSVIEPSMMLALPKDESGVAMEAERALIRSGVKNLHVLCVPACGYQADILIGAGCVSILECAGVVVSEFGVGPRFRAAVRSGSITLRDSTCPVIHAGLQAGAKGSPFAAVRGVLGSDLVKIRKDWRVIDNPLGSDGGDPVLVVPAINPDVFMFHARWGDRYGNVWISSRRDLAYTSHASRKTLVTVEEIWDGDLLADPVMSAGTLSSVYVSAVAHAPRGAWPMTLQHTYLEDTPHIGDYMKQAATDGGFEAYLQEHVYGRSRAA
jgi:glutaconate CoA-transferase subunit A